MDVDFRGLWNVRVPTFRQAAFLEEPEFRSDGGCPPVDACIHFTHLNDDLYLFLLRRIGSHIRTCTSMIASLSGDSTELPFHARTNISPHWPETGERRLLLYAVCHTQTGMQT